LKPLALALGVFLLSSAARGEIALLSTGVALKASSHHVEGDTIFLTLKEGGEVGMPSAVVRGFVPDEVLDEVASGSESDLRLLVEQAAKRHRLDPGLVLAVVAVESGFRPKAVSPKGAEGLMQIMPGTAKGLGLRDAFDPASNVDGGARYLSSLLTGFGGDVTLALAAYNAGPDAVRRHGGVPPYAETVAYIHKVLRYRSGAPGQGDAH
jgi:soluble lytic murein transglycosylase-like protein